MATTLTGALRLAFVACLTDDGELSDPADQVSFLEKWAIANGEAVDCAEELFHDRRTVAFGVTDSIDVAGSLTNGLGQTVTFTKIKMVLIKAAETNPNNLEITMPADGIPMFKTAADAVLLGADDLFLITRRAAAGIAVGAGATDQIDIVNPGGAGSCVYDIYIIGTK